MTTPVVVERQLFRPGPSNPYAEATTAQPLLGHLDPEFLRIMDQTCTDLRTVCGAENARTLPLSATGSAGRRQPSSTPYGPATSRWWR